MDVNSEFAQYRVIEHIGRGGMADVWSARDKRLSRIVAIKTIARDLTLDTDPVHMFEQEARTIAALEHPHILPIYDFGEFERQLYIAMRYVTGGSLEDILEQGPMPIADALAMARAVGTALDYAHRSKVVHLDLKPSNILLDSQGSPYLSDFGLAAIMDADGRAQNPGSGTLLYMAPEQVTSDLLDHRADVYSFCILVFHMLTGSLPFEGTMPLALQQLQMAEELPDISTVRLGLPFGLTTLLRRGTQVDLESRPASVLEVLEQMEMLLAPLSLAPIAGQVAGLRGMGGGATADLRTAAVTMPLESSDMLARREAVDIYNRARRAWAGGQGRFVLGITDFTLINDYYSQPELHNLELDDTGRQMMLRGALEYDYELDFWWEKLNDDGRRWAALHAVRGQNAAARVRALEHLEALPDTDPPQIPRIVAQTLQMENYRPAKLAAIKVLRERAHLMPVPRLKLDGQTRILGQTASILLTRTLRLWTPGEWRETVYNQEIDTLLAALALDHTDPVSAEAAARTIGSIRSQTALQRVADAQKQGSKGAVRALALIRDETPDLPGVPMGVRGFAWLTNSWRRMTDQPLELTQRFVWAVSGAALGCAVYGSVVLNQGDTGWAVLQAQNLKVIVTMILFLGTLYGLLVMLAGEFPARLQGFWPWWGRLLLSAVIGIPLGTFMWWLYQYSFLEFTPLWQPLVPAGIGMALGLIISGVLTRLPAWAKVVITAVCIYVPLHLSNVYDTGSAQTTPAILVRLLDQLYTAVLPLALLFALGAFAQPLWRQVRGLVKRTAA